MNIQSVFSWNALRVVLASLLLCLGIVAMPADQGSDKVLVIHSYHPTMRWTGDIQRGITETFAPIERTADLYVEFMDAKRIPDQDPAAFARFLEDRHADVNFKVAIVSDDAALDIAVRLRDSILAGVPVVFSGIDHLSLDADLQSADWLTGIGERIDIERNIDLALTLWPETRRILLLGDRTEIAATHRRAAEPLQQKYTDRVRIETLVPESRAALRRELAALRPDDLVFYLHYHWTEVDGFLKFEDIIPEIAELSPVPTIGAWDFSIELGMTAGYVTTGHKQGAESAKYAIDILNGTPVSSIPVHDDVANSYMINYPEAVRRSAGLGGLPGDAVVLFREPGFFERNLEGLIVSGIIVVLLVGMIGMLLIQGRTRAQGAAALMQSNQELSGALSANRLLVRETHHRVKNNLQVLTSLIELEAGRHVDESTLKALSALRNRVDAIALVHKQLYASNTVEAVDAVTYFSDILKQYRRMGATSLDDPGERLRITSLIAPVMLSADEAVPVGLLISECFSNSMKYGTTDGSQVADVEVTLHEDQADTRVLRISDKGSGFPDSDDSRGIGLTLVDALANQIGAQLSLYNHGGAVVELEWTRS